MKRHALLLGLGLPAALLLASLAFLGDLAARIPLVLILWGTAFALYAAAASLALKLRGEVDHAPGPGVSRGGSSDRTGLLLVLAVGLIPRVALIPTEATLSGDLYRYLWDGRLVAHGVNPYAHAPSDPSLTAYRGALLERLNHPDVPTIYPPAAQVLFGAAARVEASARSWKALLLLLEGVLVASLVRLLRRRSLPAERLLLYYWNPLVVVECYGSGHVDLAGAAFLLLALVLREGRRGIPAGIAFGAAALTKMTPLLLIPALLRRREWALLGAAALLACVLYLPFAHAGASLWGGLRIYVRHWDFNGALYPLIRPFFHNGDRPRLVLAGLLAASTLAAAWRARSLTGAAFAVLVAFLITSPTVYPWYLIPVVALLPLHPNAGVVVFSGLVALTYLPLDAYRTTGAWTLPGWIPAVAYGGALAAWLAGRILSRRTAGGSR